MSHLFGQESSFDFLYELYADKLYRIALSNVQNEHDASDVVHDVFLKYLNKKPAFKDASHQEGWFVKVTVNTCRDFLRKKAHRTHSPLEEVHNVGAEDKNEHDIIFYLSQLPSKYREVITLHYLEDYSVEETAKLLGLSVSGVKMRLSRGREQLKNIIEGYNND
jgi:RNA polymerase sigma-70 factor (ECF subfamily)